MQVATDQHVCDTVMVSTVLTGDLPCNLGCPHSVPNAETESVPMDMDQPTGQPDSTPDFSRPPDCSPPISPDNNDRKLIDSEFQSIQQLTAKFDMDACCDNRGENALVPYMYCSPNNSFLQHNCASQHVWLNPPFDNAAEFIKHYKQCKASSPHNTSACILVPNWKRAPWQHMLKGMQVIKQYSVGTRLFEAPPLKPGSPRVLLPGIPWGVTVYYDWCLWSFRPFAVATP